MNKCNDKDVMIFYENKTYCFSPEDVKEWFEISYADQKGEMSLLSENRKNVLEAWKKTQPKFLISQLDGMVDFNFKDSIKNGINEFIINQSSNSYFYLNENQYNIPYLMFDFKVIKNNEIKGEQEKEIKERIPSSSMLEKCYNKKDLLENDIVFDNNTIVFFVTKIHRQALREVQNLLEEWIVAKKIPLYLYIEELEFTPMFTRKLSLVIKKYFEDYVSRTSSIIRNFKMLVDNFNFKKKTITISKFLKSDNMESLIATELQIVDTDSYNCITISDMNKIMKEEYRINQGSFNYDRYFYLEKELQYVIENYNNNPTPEQIANNPLLKEYMKLLQQYLTLNNMLTDKKSIRFRKLLYYWIEDLDSVIKNKFNTINLVEMPQQVILFSKQQADFKTTYYKACPSSRIMISNENDNNDTFQMFVLMEDEKEKKEDEKTFKLFNIATNQFVEYKEEQDDVEDGMIIGMKIKYFDFGIEQKDEFPKIPDPNHYHLGFGMKTLINDKIIYENMREPKFSVFGKEYVIDTNRAIYVYSFDANNVIDLRVFKFENEYIPEDHDQNYEINHNVLAGQDEFMTRYLESEGKERAKEDLFIRNYLADSTGVKLKNTQSKIITGLFQDRINIPKGVYIYASTSNDNMTDESHITFDMEHDAEMNGYECEKLLLYRNMDFQGDDGVVVSIPVKIGTYVLESGTTFIICDDSIDFKIVFSLGSNLMPKFVYYEIEDVQDSIKDENDYLNEDENEDENENENM